MTTSISYWFWDNLSIVIIAFMVLAILGYALLLWIAINDLKDWKDFFDKHDS